MMIKCSKCGKLYDYEKYNGICPKCARYNRDTSAAAEHQEYHNQYDGGYNHSASDSHYSFHERYDGAETPHAHYRQTPAEHASQLDGVQETLREVMGAEHKVTLEVENKKKLQNKKSKLAIGVLIAMVVIFLLPFIGSFLPFLLFVFIIVTTQKNKRNKSSKK